MNIHIQIGESALLLTALFLRQLIVQIENYYFDTYKHTQTDLSVEIIHNK